MSSIKEKTSFSLTTRWGADLVASVCASFALSWIITPMDASIFASMSGKSTIKQSLSQGFREILTKPHHYIRRPEFGVIFGVYSLTYMAKNMTDTTCSFYAMSPEKTAFYKFWIVLAVNGSACIFWRDPSFAKIFGTKTPTSIPLMSYVFWFGRDVSHTIGAVVTPDYLESAYSLTTQQWKIAQFSCPLLVQFITSPLHLFGLDMYNHKESSFKCRMSRVSQLYFPSVGVRMCRMMAPWSIGLIANREIREFLTPSYSTGEEN